MPGITGIVSKDKTNEQTLDNMIDSMKYEDFYRVDKHIEAHFGIARVHIGVFNPEIQPIFNEDKSLCIIFYGKIYDYKEEMEELKLKGNKFRFENDAEFCLYSYMEYGSEFVKKLNGSFIFAIYDFNKDKIIIVNDRYGSRPFYYTVNDNVFLFSSEIKAILKGGFIKGLNHEAVADWFAFGKILGDKTFFEDITVLPPASILSYDGQNLSIEEYWDYNFEPDYHKSENELVDELVAAFKKAVRIRMEDDYKYGTSLSGGLDSRVIIAAIDEDKRSDILSFSFGPLDCDEVKIAKKVSDKANTKFRAIEINPEMIIDNAGNEIFYTDGLDYIGVSFIPPVLKTVKDEVEVVFDGFAFDLILGGSFLDKRILNTKNKEELLNILYSKSILFSDEELNKLFTHDYYEKIKNLPLKSFKKEFELIDGNDIPNISDKFALKNHVRRWTVGGHILMRVLLENTIPTLDNNLINLISKIPPELRFSHKIYRKFLNKISPELARIPYDKTMVRAGAPSIVWKMGLGYQLAKANGKEAVARLSRNRMILPKKRSYVNFNEWLKTNENWKKYFRELLLTEETASKEFINQNYVKTLIDDHEKGKSENSMKILFIASFELFLRIFINEEFMDESNISDLSKYIMLDDSIKEKD